MAAAVRQETRCDTDPVVRELLEEVRSRLADRVSNPHHRFEVASTEDPQPTAFALPGGYIFVARSLVTLCESRSDEVAFVVAHEMAHVIRRHAIDRLMGQTALSALSQAAPGRGVVGAWLKTVGVQWLERAYSQDQEFEADELGGLLMRAAGYDPSGCVRALERLQPLDATADTELGPYLSTHPPVPERVTRLRERLEL